MRDKILSIFGMCIIYGAVGILVEGYYTPMVVVGDVMALFVFAVVLTLVIMSVKWIFGNKETFKMDNFDLCI